jgi:hypothetical protein
MPTITQQRLHELLRYNPKTGLFTWRFRVSNRVHVGKIAGTPRANGYIAIRVDGRIYLAHRLAFLYMSGALPPSDIDVDHEDTDPSNNRWANLRFSTHSENLHNSRLNKRNTSGFKGVRPYLARFQARIAINKQQIHLGTFDTAEEAHAAYAAAAVESFGEFARVA